MTIFRMGQFILIKGTLTLTGLLFETITGIKSPCKHSYLKSLYLTFTATKCHTTAPAFKENKWALLRTRLHRQTHLIQTGQQQQQHHHPIKTTVQAITNSSLK